MLVWMRPQVANKKEQSHHAASEDMYFAFLCNSVSKGQIAAVCFAVCATCSIPASASAPPEGRNGGGNTQQHGTQVAS
jgi:hypothetical protein